MNILAKPINIQIRVKIFVRLNIFDIYKTANEATCINNFTNISTPWIFFLWESMFVETDDSYTKMFITVWYNKENSESVRISKYTESGYKLYHLWWNII